MGKTPDEKDMSVYKSRVGQNLRIHTQFNRRSDPLSVDRFCDGIGEGNPLFRDDGHPGGRIAPPSFILSVFPGWVLQGLPGMHAFHTAMDIQFYMPIPMDAEIDPVCRFKGYRRLPGKLGEDNFLEIQETQWLDMNGKPFASAEVTGIRAQRADARSADIYRSVTLPHPWTDEELSLIENRVLSERPRGASPLYIEDVSVGDELSTLTKGPLGITDMIAYCIGASPVRLLAHGLALEEFRRHPAWAFHDSNGSTLEPMFGVHYCKAAAEYAGMPYPFDLGSQRHAWLIQLLTNWMGDSGLLLRCQAKYTGFVFLSDVVTLGGRVKEINGDRITVSTRAVNQRGETVMKGISQLVLPHRGDVK